MYYTTQQRDFTEVIAPQDADAERQFLGACLLMPELVNGVPRPEDFFDKAHQRIYAAMQELRDDGKLIDVVLLTDLLKRRGDWEAIGGAGYISRLVNSVATAYGASFHAELICEKSRLRRQVQMANEILQQVADGLPPDDIDALPEMYLETVRAERAKNSRVPNMAKLIETHKQLRRPVIHGLLREGETLNLIGVTKMGKSWLTYLLLLSIVTGKRFLGKYPPVPGRCLLIDNELHPETIADRIPRVAAAMGLETNEWAEKLEVVTLRGRLEDINGINRRLATFPPGTYKCVAIDALYRALPPGCDENSNSNMAAVYNTVDSIADRQQCAIVLVHHSTKGSQTGKLTTEVGAGAGATSRAADTHFILRSHDEADAAVADGAVRSWSPIEPFCLRWSFPLWTLAEDLDPTRLRKDKPRRTKTAAAPDEQVWDSDRFAARFLTAEPMPKPAIFAKAKKAGLSDRRAENFLQQAVASGMAHRCQKPEDRRFILYASIKQN